MAPLSLWIREGKVKWCVCEAVPRTLFPKAIQWHGRSEQLIVRAFALSPERALDLAAARISAFHAVGLTSCSLTKGAGLISEKEGAGMLRIALRPIFRCPFD
jgi:hypothetical protein